MDADVTALQRFQDAPYVIEAPAAASPLADAAKASAASRLRLRLDERNGLSVDRYREILRGVQAQVDAELGGGRPGYRIEVFDKMAPNALEKGRRAFKGLGLDMREAMGSPFAKAFRTGGGATCVVVGWTPDRTPADVYAEGLPEGTVPDTGGLSTEGFHKASLWHEVGHCLLGGSEAKADTFAALMLLRHTDEPVSALSALATFREVAELSSPDPTDDHFMASSLWHVVEIADALRASSRFMSMGMEDIAGVASTLADRYGTTPEQERHIKSLRAALHHASTAKMHYVPGPDGLRPANFSAWLGAHSDIAEIERFKQVSVGLVEGAKPLKPFPYDPIRLRRTLSRLADAGDPTAKGMLRDMGRRLPEPPRPPLSSIGPNIDVPYAFGPAKLSDDVIGFDPRVQTVAFSRDQTRWQVSDRESGHPVATGAIDPAGPGFREVRAPRGGQGFRDLHLAKAPPAEAPRGPRM